MGAGLVPAGNGDEGLRGDEPLGLEGHTRESSPEDVGVGGRGPVSPCAQETEPGPEAGEILRSHCPELPGPGWVGRRERE